MFGALEQAAIVPLAGIIGEGAAANPDDASPSFLTEGRSGNQWSSFQFSSCLLSGVGLSMTANQFLGRDHLRPRCSTLPDTSTAAVLENLRQVVRAAIFVARLTLVDKIFPATPGRREGLRARLS